MDADHPANGVPFARRSTIFIWMINTEGHVHIIITGTLSAFLGLVIFLIAAMDYPFRGEVSIDAAPFEQVYTNVMETERPAS